MAPEDRDWLLHGIGNLTLVSGRLNASLSNAPWTVGGEGGQGKRGALRQHSKLEMNRLLLDQHEDWHEDRIRIRAEQLFEQARVVWPPCPVPSAG